MLNGGVLCLHIESKTSTRTDYRIIVSYYVRMHIAVRRNQSVHVKYKTYTNRALQYLYK